jgi:hypothetical protein
LFHLLVTTTAWHQAWHLPSLTSNDELMPGCIAGESRDGEVGASCRLLWIGRKSRPFVISAMQFDETTPARRCLLQSWYGVRAAYPQCRSSNANSLRWRVLAQPRRVVTTSQIHSPPSDSRVRVSPPQPGSRLSSPDT